MYSDSLMFALLSVVLASASVLMTAGTLVSFSGSPHWFFRLWDFPRVQIALVSFAANLLYGVFFFDGTAFEVVMIAAGVATVAWQCYKIFPYTPLAKRRVQDVDPETRNRDDRRNRLSLLVSNVLMDNREYGRLIALVKQRDPDVILIVENDQPWMDALEVLAERYPFIVRRPLDNFYGIAVFSRLELVDPEVKFLVQDDIPSVHTRIRLEGGEEVFFYALHPRPPEPIRDQPSAPRDAELVMVGREIGDHPDRPTIIAGDLNDVAWSPTSELFLRLSGLLDPRHGRGFYNSFSAKSRLFRYPLDHVFHSNEFKLIDLQRLPAIGSDHFPIFIELLYDPQAAAGQPETEKQPGDETEADGKLHKQAEAAATGDGSPEG